MHGYLWTHAMKFEHCALHRGTDRDDLPCLRIRHDDGRVAMEAEVWTEMQRLQAQAFAAEEDAALWEERARHLGWRDCLDAA